MEAVAKGRPKPKAFAAGETIPLLANSITARGFDRTLTMSHNRGLPSFVERQHWQFLPEGCTRYFLSAADPDLPGYVLAMGQTQRASIKDAEGATRLENPTKARSELHTIVDCGISSFVSDLWLHTRCRMDGSHASAVVAHDAHNSHLLEHRV